VGSEIGQFPERMQDRLMEHLSLPAEIVTPMNSYRLISVTEVLVTSISLWLFTASNGLLHLGQQRGLGRGGGAWSRITV
jgi:hypothetical protein